MTWYENVESVKMIAGEDFDDDDGFKLLKFGTSGKVIKCTAAADTPIGVLAEPADFETDNALPVALFKGIVPMKTTAAAISVGDAVEMAANGVIKTVPGGSSNPVLGVALSSVSATGGVVSVFAAANYK